MTREDEIAKRLEILDRLPPDETVAKMLHADVRYLLENVERLQACMRLVDSCCGADGWFQPLVQARDLWKKETA